MSDISDSDSDVPETIATSSSRQNSGLSPSMEAINLPTPPAAQKSRGINPEFTDIAYQGKEYHM